MENNNAIIDARIKEDTGYKNLPRSTVIVDVVINGVCHRLETEFSGEMVREEDDEKELGKSRQNIAFYQNGCLFQDGYNTANPGTYEVEEYTPEGHFRMTARRFKEIEYNDEGERIN
tara:strand:+ start:3065 stop:3415 length:351 start_codon:yes stop_codon:yes gene_type:complete